MINEISFSFKKPCKYKSKCQCWKCKCRCEHEYIYIIYNIRIQKGGNQKMRKQNFSKLSLYTAVVVLYVYHIHSVCIRWLCISECRQAEWMNCIYYSLQNMLEVALDQFQQLGDYLAWSICDEMVVFSPSECRRQEIWTNLEFWHMNTHTHVCFFPFCYCCSRRKTRLVSVQFKVDASNAYLISHSTFATFTISNEEAISPSIKSKLNQKK